MYRTGVFRNIKDYMSSGKLKPGKLKKRQTLGIFPEWFPGKITATTRYKKTVMWTNNEMCMCISLSLKSKEMSTVMYLKLYRKSFHSAKISQ